MTTDALSQIANTINGPKLEFSTWFGSGVSLGSLTEITPGRYYQYVLSGADALTGSVFPDSLFDLMGSNTTATVQFIPDLSFIGTGSITGTKLNITQVLSGALTVGTTIESSNGSIIDGTTISSFDTGTGGVGLYNVSNSQSVASTTINAPGYTIANLPAHIEGILQSTTYPKAPSGAKELYVPVHNRKATTGGNSRPQGIFMITRNGVGGLPPPDLQEIYTTSIHFIPANLDSRLVPSYGSSFYVLKDWKTGGWTGGNALGDYRLSLQIVRSSDGQPLYYKLAGDNNANGNWNVNLGPSGSVPQVGTVNSAPGSSYWVSPIVVGSAMSDLGCWVRIHLYIKRPQISTVISSDKESGARDPMYVQDLTTGITFAAVENLTNNTWQTIGLQLGAQQMGCANLPFARMMEATCYCTANDAADPIVFAKATGWQVWRKPPISLPI